MKAIHITSDLELTLPKELAEMFLKSSKLGVFHISYKMPCWVSEDYIDDIKQSFNDVSGKIAAYCIDFDRYVVNKSDTYTIMLGTKNKNDAAKAQRKILTSVNAYCQHHLKPNYLKYENDFNPHITIAYDVSDEELLSHLSKLVSPICIRAKVNSATLRITDGKIPGFSVLEQITCDFRE